MHEAPPRPLTGGAVLAAASRISVALAGAATTVVLARVLGPEGWGRYAVAQSLVVVLLAATTLGIEHGIAYYVGSGRWAPRSALAAATHVAVVTGALGAGAGVAARVLAPSAFAGLPLWVAGVAAAGLPFALVAVYASYVALATDRYEASMLMPAAQAVLVLAGGIPGGVVFGVSGAVVAMTAAAVAVGAGSLLWAGRRLPPARSGEPGQLRRAISFGVKGYAANALQLVNYRLDMFVLAAVASTATVGRYALAVAITSLLWLLPRALSDVLFPRVARLSGADDADALRLVEEKSVRHASLAVAAGVVALAAGLELLVAPVFGARYRPAAGLGLILLPGMAAIGVGTVLAATVVGRGRPVYSLYVALVTTPLTVVLYATLIPWLHANGAALGSTISYVIGFALTARFYRRVTGSRVLPLLVPTRSELDDLRALWRRRRERERR